MDNDYKVLPIASGIFKVLAWIGLSLGTLSCFIILLGGGAPETPRWMGLVTLIVGVLYFFFFMVASEGVKLLLEIKDKIK
ncbi:MAG: hypothetical protein HZA27_00310 [Candidatus Omnitrophica bacterium]|nr:hypothetical protein [Candidatus Omnitrophota bacterium]